MMHDTLVERLETDAQIRQFVGEVDTVDFDSVGSNAEFGGAQSETLWILKVTGDRGCIYVHAVLDETFPSYRVISVKPRKFLQGRVLRAQTCSY